jgi:hypothetical protein
MYPLNTTGEFKKEISDKVRVSLKAERRAKLRFLADKHHESFFSRPALRQLPPEETGKLNL